MLKILTSLFLLFVAPEVLADIFQLAEHDRSVELLGSLFGPSVGSEILGGIYQPVMSTVIKSFNLIIMVFGIITASYVSIVSVANTAQEGSAMGEKWSAVWVPLRSVIGLALMIPSPTSGYSSIQSFIMWAVINGVGAADQLWEVVLHGIQDGATIAANTHYMNNGDVSTANPKMNNQAHKLAQNILLANTCMVSLRTLATLPEPSEDQKVKLALYQEINGTNTSPITNSPLLRYGPSLSGYIEPNSIVTDTSKSDYYTKTATYNFGAQNAIDPNNPNGSAQWKDICGSMKITVSVGLSDYSSDHSITALGPNQEKDLERVFDTAVNGLQGMSSLFSILANNIVTNNVQPQTKLNTPSSNPTYTFLQNLSSNNNLNPKGYVSLAQRAYVQNMLTGTVPLPQGGYVQDTIEQGLLQGWLTAGSFYFILSKNNGNQVVFKTLNGDDAIATFNTQPPHCDGPIATNSSCLAKAYAPDSDNKVDTDNIDHPGSPTQISNALGSGSYAQGFVTMFLAQATTYYNIENADSIEHKIDPTNNSPEQIGSSLTALNPVSGNVSVINTTIALIGDGDVIVGLSKYGYSLMATAEASLTAIYAGLFVTAVTVGVSGTEINIPFLGSFEFNGFTEMWSTIMPIILSLVLPMFSAMWTFGAGLNMYLPMIPYMIFMVSAIGWGILVIEAMVAAPILALGLVTPGGDELGKAEEGLGILASICLRPVLMVLGFILAARIYQTIIIIVNNGIADTYRLIGSNGSIGNGQGTTFSWLAALGIYVTFVVSLANKCFGFIYVLPDQIMRWLGSHRETSTGAHQELGEAKQAQEKTNTAINASATGAGQLAGRTAEINSKKVDAQLEAGNTKLGWNKVKKDDANEAAPANPAAVNNSQNPPTPPTPPTPPASS